MVAFEVESGVIGAEGRPFWNRLVLFAAEQDKQPVSDPEHGLCSRFASADELESDDPGVKLDRPIEIGDSQRDVIE